MEEKGCMLSTYCVPVPEGKWCPVTSLGLSFSLWSEAEVHPQSASTCCVLYLQPPFVPSPGGYGHGSQFSNDKCSERVIMCRGRQGGSICRLRRPFPRPPQCVCNHAAQFRCSTHSAWCDPAEGCTVRVRGHGSPGGPRGALGRAEQVGGPSYLPVCWCPAQDEDRAWARGPGGAQHSSTGPSCPPHPRNLCATGALCWWRVCWGGVYRTDRGVGTPCRCVSS